MRLLFVVPKLSNPMEKGSGPVVSTLEMVLLSPFFIRRFGLPIS
jgi:hypothetical protein